MNTPNRDPPPPPPTDRSGRQSNREIDTLLLESIEARYAENAEVTLQMVAEIIGDEDPVGDEGWDQDAEDSITVSWETSLRKRSSDKVGTRGNNDDPLRELWRFCLRFMKQAPPIMLSPMNGVQFMPARQIGDFATSSHLFTQAACSTLAKLVIHPLWSGNHHPFLDALKFAALCRVDAKANINLSLRWPAHCPVIQDLNGRLMEAGNTSQSLPETLPKLHMAAREAVHERGERQSVFSEVLSCIGQIVVAEAPSKAEKAQLRQGVIPFQGKDLDVIKKAIDELALTDDRMPFSVEDVHTAFKFVGHRSEIPSRQLLQSLDARACKQVFRMSERPDLFGSKQAKRQKRIKRPDPEPATEVVFERTTDPVARGLSTLTSDRDFGAVDQDRPPVDSSRHSNFSANRPSNQYNRTHGTPDSGHQKDHAHFSAQDIYVPGGTEAEVPTRRSLAPLSLGGRPPLDQALAVDDHEQVRRNVATLGEQLDAEKAERCRQIEDLKVQQAEEFEVIKRQNAGAIATLKSEHDEAIASLKTKFDDDLQALRSQYAGRLGDIEAENTRASDTATTQARLIDDLKIQSIIFSAHLATLSTKQSETERRCNEQAGLIKTLQEENERLRQSAWAAPAPTAEHTSTVFNEWSQVDVAAGNGSSGQAGTVMGAMERVSERTSLPRVQGGFTATTIPSVTGSTTAQINHVPKRED
ncbi:hypothetical protein FGLOB1_1178 [Fusarium globosum]|uniref:Uncharacterized protein n=1 Tax=Fusarium globosum TaxID=78864 RepID=A0A8H6DLE3_9HYPO|nr:hypothetical protein FGLOB1_1178 [Fusarium globosum]